MSPTVRFNLEDGIRAADEWGCNCGPGALAAITGMTLDEVRPHMGDFERKGYTNPTLMFDVLKNIGVKHYISAVGRPNGYSGRTALLGWPRFGLARIQWEGPWTKPGSNPRWAYRHTHWVGAKSFPFVNDTGIFDINCINNGSGWISFDDWRSIVVPHILKECVPRASGEWHLTHVIEVGPHA